VKAVAPAARATREALYIPSLDGIRAAAVMLVFAAHAGLKERVPGNFGVTVFFFLSGYLITTLLRAENERTGRVSLRSFYLRRVLRIFPPFYLVLVVASALTVVGALPGPRLEPGALLAQASYLTNYLIIQHGQLGWWEGIAPGTWIFWSLSVEEYFYLGFPLLYLALLRWLPGRGRQALVLLGICAVVLAWRVVLVLLLDASKERTYIATDTRIDSILFGCVLGLYGNPVLDSTRVGERVWKLALVPLALAGLVVSFAMRSPHLQETVRYSLQGLCLFPLFVTAVRWPRWLPLRLLNVGWVKFLGLLSYSIYLVHPAVLWGVTSWTRLPAPVQAAIGLALTLLIALVIYELIEKPAARLRRRLSRVPGASRGEAAPARNAATLPGGAAPQPGGLKP
jgi:peptidoglycan/LPS O-acetylase OafA/YrhL